jgi:hypothetical protein
MQHEPQTAITLHMFAVAWVFQSRNTTVGGEFDLVFYCGLRAGDRARATLILERS